MNNQVELIRKWIDERSQREKVFLFLLGLAVIYLLFYFIFIRPLTSSSKQIKEDQNKIQTQIEVVRGQISTILQVVSDPNFQQMFQEQKKLHLETSGIASRLTAVKPSVLKVENYSQVVKDILAVRGEVVLVRINRLPSEPWIPKDLNNLNLPLYFNTIYQYQLEINLKGNFFSILAYLQSLEKLSWPIFWDSMNYKVTGYPNADLTLKLHVLIEQKGGL